MTAYNFFIRYYHVSIEESIEINLPSLPSRSNVLETKEIPGLGSFEYGKVEPVNDLEKSVLFLID